jgi:hypothetical protein
MRGVERQESPPFQLFQAQPPPVSWVPFAEDSLTHVLISLLGMRPVGKFFDDVGSV